MLQQSDCGDLDDDIVDAELCVRIQLVNRSAHIRGAIHFDFIGQEKVRHGPQRRNQPACDCSAHLTKRLVAVSRWRINFILCAWSWQSCSMQGWCALWRSFLSANSSLNVALYNSPSRAAPLQ